MPTWAVWRRKCARKPCASCRAPGGHLGSSLGVVELTVALHAVFNTPHDKLIWDVGHQCYPHKILTGRRAPMAGLRQKAGPSGFTRRCESAHDPFGAAHSSTSISAALGFAIAHDMGQPPADAIAVIGDGAITAGMAYEAMNHAGDRGRRLFVILNDNGMSIAPPTGAMNRYLTRLQTTTPGAALRDMAAGFEALLPGPLRDHARNAAMTRSCMMWPCRACRCGLPSTARACWTGGRRCAP